MNHEALVEKVALKLQRNFWPSGEKSARDQARAIIALIAEETKTATTEMDAAWCRVDPNLTSEELSGADWSAMHRASALWP